MEKTSTKSKRKEARKMRNRIFWIVTDRYYGDILFWGIEAEAWKSRPNVIRVTKEA